MSDTVKVRILTDTHEHNDKPVPKGTVLDVSPKTAAHFVETGTAEIVPAAPATKATGGAE